MKRSLKKSTWERNNEIYKYLFDPRGATLYCIKKRKRIKGLEPIISTDSWASLNYACHVLKDRFVLGEDSIFKDEKISSVYVSKLIYKPQSDLEPKIAKYVDSTWEYLFNILLPNTYFKIKEVIVQHLTKRGLGKENLERMSEQERLEKIIEFRKEFYHENNNK